jgi:hypothetical protein
MDLEIHFGSMKILSPEVHALRELIPAAPKCSLTQLQRLDPSVAGGRRRGALNTPSTFLRSDSEHQIHPLRPCQLRRCT